MRKFFFAVVLLFAFHSIALAVPQLINYQGKLSDNTGTPVNTTVNMVFSIYDVATSGSALWTETQDVTVNKGLFHVLLGSVSSFPSTLFDNDTLYLGVQIIGDDEMTPRQRMASSPYAISKGVAVVDSVPSGYSISSDTPIPPIGYTFTGDSYDTSRWVIKTTLPTYFTNGDGILSATVNNVIHIWDSEGNIHYEYNPLTNIWTLKNPHPIGYTSDTNSVAVVVNNKVHIIGTAHYMYDYETDTYTSKSPIPTARSGMAAGVVNNKIYVIGGNVAGTNEEYDPSNDTWSPKAPLLTPRYRARGVVFNDKIYAIGGRLFAGTIYVAITEEYDPSTDLWTSKSPMRARRLGFGAALLGNQIFAVGGIGDDPGGVEVFNSNTNSWNHTASLHRERDYVTAVSTNGTIYVLGGYGILSLEEYVPGRIFYIHRKN